METKIIDKLVLLDEINNKELILNFKKGMNIIIGSKGGGKSTLLSLIHSMHNQQQPNNEILSTLKSFKLKIKYLEYSNNEKINYDSLEKYKVDVEHDIISQEDKIKTALTNTKEVEKDRNEFIKELIKKSIKSFTLLIEKYKSTLLKLSEKKNLHNINWNLLVHFNQAQNEKLTELKHRLFNSFELENYDDIFVALYSLNTIYTELLKNHDTETYNKAKSLLNELADIHLKKAKQEKTKNKINQIYKEILEEQRKILKQSSNLEVNMTNLKEESKKLFDEAAIQLARNHILYKKLFSPSLRFEFNSKKDTHYGMSLVIDKEIIVNDLVDDENVEDSWIFKIFDSCFYKPKNKKNDWVNWVLKSLEKNDVVKNDNHDLVIENNIKEKLKDHIKIMADGKDYNTMSLGTRTSFGIKQKIKCFQDNILFLDQPEDNLDNFTIFNELIKIFDENKQFFMVTHNSNFGILTNPQTITTCSLNKLNPLESYHQELNIMNKINIPSEENIQDSPARHYLEGGQESLKKRFEKLIKKGE